MVYSSGECNSEMTVLCSWSPVICVVDREAEIQRLNGLLKIHTTFGQARNGECLSSLPCLLGRAASCLCRER